MASVFTYDPDPPRVASPWLQQDEKEGESARPSADAVETLQSAGRTPSKVTRLHAEPQEGPVEYKLHLLLRPRRKFRSTSTGNHVSGSRHAKFGGSHSARAVPECNADQSSNFASGTPPPASTQPTRQHRLEQLTTQLLWRLQQSSPHHTSSASNIILPSLPEALPELPAPQQPAKLLHGLEESQGALYEIGVSDDGTLVGLAEDELQESLNNLRAMAACLGCTVEVLRREAVGECEWIEDITVGGQERRARKIGKLMVAEALIKPQLQTSSPNVDTQNHQKLNEPSVPLPGDNTPATEQVRVTLTGPTMSGKSSLLGTLTTSTLDNGRGKSRLSMLKHRHEITSGITSSVTQEIVGYQDIEDGEMQVINYGTENVASWIDVHVAASGNRLVFVSDSAGHPRYRRTTVRGLVGWAPHWTLLCVPADDTEDAGRTGSTSASQRNLGPAVSDLDLSSAQLDLCLRLNLPLVVVITKLDLASRSGLKDSLTKILDALKAAGKKPAILANPPGAVAEEELQVVRAAQVESAYHTSLPLLNDPLATVPIVLTSAVQGTGISNLHALLHELPLPQQGNVTGNFATVFHIEDVYSKPAEVEGLIISGRLRHGRVTVGDSVVLGPFSGAEQVEDSEDSDERPFRRASNHLPTSRSFPGALRDSHLNSRYFQLPSQEWRRVKVNSIRNLRLPVHALLPDQVGTISVVPEEDPNDDASMSNKHKKPATPHLHRIRKGMILAAVQPASTRTFVAEFQRQDLEALAVGSHIVVYIASVRASARVVSARTPDSTEETTRGKRRGNGSLMGSPRDGDEEPNEQEEHQRDHHEEGEDGGETDPFAGETDPFAFEDLQANLPAANGSSGPSSHAIAPQGESSPPPSSTSLLVTFSFDSSKEFLLLGDAVLVMPGGGPGLYGGQERGEKGVAGLEGFVGTVVEVHG
ncbi:P-loop containing nucleoside triphosphate hydrolase protein [Hortaea werneckii]|nr:P-loop containing nucleoside triphosphate hydrolase protein [Hortaea werneckii]KAI6992159.1 P-loop containing nucleoside triphosphate hydrolase protein [Hortaea werneckii]KAI7144406.1 P-loop containing nucleoside triphosphate hydrolase protein [Hortaea werneckii]KAI7172671.1 P-loop containing nucleoside triphosphate hydrolase protein [Hortaea werneckii]KAI7187996.1 P-loop containing nucleoside triphosphate hydrolase protein [Hortaea werneckii]